MAGNLVISQINGGPIGVINAIINGNYQINQRGVSGTVTLTAGNYGHDRWKAGSGGCVYTFATANNVTTLTITAGTLIQVIEGSNLYSGTYVLSFTGTAQGKIGAGSFAASGVTGTATGGTDLNIEFNTGTVSLVQFEHGSEVSPFERRDIGRELALCQRYFEKSVNQNTSITTINQTSFFATVSSTTVANSVTYATQRYVVTKRTAPTVLVYPYTTATNTTRISNDGGTDLAANSAFVNAVSDAFFSVANTSGGTITTGAQLIFIGNWYASAEL